jgi:hypothetical protein
MSIGGAITGGTPGEALMVGAGPVLAQTTNLPVSVFNSGVAADSAHFWRGDGTWASALAPPPYTPTVLGSALRAWYEMDKLTGSAGSSQSAIPDQSGNGFNLSQGTTSQQGTLAVADQNGLNTLRFTQASSQNYQLALAIMSGATAGSMYMVYRVVSTASWNAMLDMGGAPAGYGDWPYSDGNIYTNFGSTGQQSCGAPTASLTNYRIISLIAASNDYRLYVDGGTGGSSGGTAPLYNSASNTVAWTTTPPLLGAATGLSSALDGWIAEIYFTSAAQLTSERQRNEGYLAWKWGLTGNLDPSHPYKSVAPTEPLPPVLSIGDIIASGTSGSVLFLGTDGVLAQDNANFFWDDTMYHLKIGSASTTTGTYYLNNLPALYQVPNGSGASWFEGNSGNTTLTGYQNFGTGDGALQLLTTGNRNTAVGTNTLHSVTTGTNNFAFGTNALYTLTSGSSNVAVGLNALYNSNGTQNTAMGQSALFGMGLAGGGNDNTAIGFGAFSGAQFGSGNIGIGTSSATTMTSGSYNTFVGSTSGTNLAGDNARNTFIGANSGANVTSALDATMLGCWGGTAAYYNQVVTIAAGLNLVQDFNWIATNRWSFQNATTPVGLNVYNTFDGLFPPTNYERGILDWNATANIFRLGTQAGGTGTVRLIAIDGFQKAGAPAAGDLPSGTFALVNDTSGGQTWLAYNAAGTIRKVQLT